MMRWPKDARPGFTLIELLVAITLAALLLTATTGIIKNALGTDAIVAERNLLQREARFAMERMVSAVHDYMIYNLTVRYGRSNPHSSIGYFIHPRIAKIIVDWLRQVAV